MNPSLLLHQRPVCLVHLIWMVLEIWGTWLYSYCFVRCFFQDLSITAGSILVQLLSNFFSLHFVSVHMVHPYSTMDTTAAWKKLHFILSDRSDLHMTDSISIAFYAFASHVLMSFLVDEILLPRYVNLITSFKEAPFSVEMSPFWFWLKPMYPVLSALTWRPIPLAAFSRLCSWDLA